MGGRRRARCERLRSLSRCTWRLRLPAGGRAPAAYIEDLPSHLSHPTQNSVVNPPSSLITRRPAKPALQPVHRLLAIKRLRSWSFGASPEHVIPSRHGHRAPRTPLCCLAIAPLPEIAGTPLSYHRPDRGADGGADHHREAMRLHRLCGHRLDSCRIIPGTTTVSRVPPSTGQPTFELRVPPRLTKVVLQLSHQERSTMPTDVISRSRSPLPPPPSPWPRGRREPQRPHQRSHPTQPEGERGT